MAKKTNIKKNEYSRTEVANREYMDPSNNEETILQDASVLDLMYMMRQLMDMGYEKLRWVSYMSPTGLCLRCHITMQDNIAPNYEPIRFDKDRLFAVATNQLEATADISLLVDVFKRCYHKLLESCKGKDAEYKEWFERLIKEVESRKLPTFTAEYTGYPKDKIQVGDDWYPAPPKEKVRDEVAPRIRARNNACDQFQIIDEFVKERVLYKECAVAGVSFHLKYNDEIWDELEVGTKVALIRERKNKYDKNAVAIALAKDYDGNPDDFDFIIGYIPKEENVQIAQMLDMGWEDVFVAELTTVKRYGKITDRLRISVYIQGKEPKHVRPDLLRAESLSTSELRDMVEELNERGTACFRWGGFCYSEFAFPIVGEKIVMVHCDEDSEVLYLLRVLAKGKEDCARYVDFPEMLDCLDDRDPYVLTNVMGPVRIKKSKHKFLTGVDMKGLSATEYLPPHVSDGFKQYFESLLSDTLSED